MARIEGDATGTQLDKRTYLPGVIVYGDCSTCGNESETNLDSDYLSYPIVGQRSEVSIYCETCDDYFRVPVILRLTLELAEKDEEK